MTKVTPDTLLETVDATLSAYEAHLVVLPHAERGLSAETPVDTSIATKRRGMLRHLTQVHEMGLSSVQGDWYGLTLAEIKAKHNAFEHPGGTHAVVLHTGATP